MEVDIKSFIIKENDTLPSLSITVIDRGCFDEKIPFILSAVTATTFTMIDECNQFKILEGPANITSSSGGTIEYTWSSADTDTPGRFKGEFRLSFSGGPRMTLPLNGSIDIFIQKSINPF